MMELNTQVFRAINDLGKDYSFLNPFFVFIAEYTLYLLIFAVLAFLFSKKSHNRIISISALLAVIIAEIIGKLISLLHFNYQPFVDLKDVNQLISKDIGNSFPSDHTIIFFTVCFTFVFFGNRFKLLWIALALLVGFSRIWVGVHYPADVLMGAIIGIAAAYVCYAVLSKSRSLQKLLSGKGYFTQK